MKFYLSYFILGSIIFALLLPQEPKPVPELFLSNPPFFPRSYRISCPEAFKGDTIVNLSIFDFSKYETHLLKKKKRRLINKAVMSTLSEDKIYRYLSDEYWKVDTAKKEFESVVCKSCSYDDFYLMDLDNDGDLDIIYSSMLNDYVHDDSNELLLFRNDNGRWQLHRISGFAQHANFKNQDKGHLIFSMVGSPCCEEICYHFSMATFNIKTWTSTSKRVVAIGSSKINLVYPAKDIL